MFIKNQKFTDEETLMEVLFDFDLGEPSAYTRQQYEQIAKELEGDAEYQDYMATLEEDDKRELAVEERDIRLAEILMREFESFEVLKAKLYGIKGDEKTLLYEVDLH